MMANYTVPMANINIHNLMNKSFYEQKFRNDHVIMKIREIFYYKTEAIW